MLRPAIASFLLMFFLLSAGCTSQSTTNPISQGDRYMVEQNWDAAIRAYQQALSINVDSFVAKTKLALAYNQRGWTSNQNKSWDVAIKDFTTALQYNPTLSAAYHNRGLAYDMQGQQLLVDAYSVLMKDANTDEALKYMDEALAVFLKAINDLSNAVKLNPTSNLSVDTLAIAYNDRGHTYNLRAESQGFGPSAKEWQYALTHLNNAIKLNPRLIEAYNNRGWAYDGKHEWDAAIADLTIVVNANPIESRDYGPFPILALAYNNRGWAYHETKRYQESLDDLNKAIEMAPQLTVAYLNRGITYYFLGNKESAQKDFETVLGMTKDPELVRGAKQGLALLGVSAKL